jgi:hypothetical protein
LSVASSSVCNSSLDANWPCSWTLEQNNEFSSKYDWLTVSNRWLGCGPCNKIGTLSIEKKTGMRVAKEWANNEVTHYGKNRSQQLSSLQKKMFEHKESGGYKAALKLLAEAEKETLPYFLVKTLAREKE